MTKQDATKAIKLLEQDGWPNVHMVKYDSSWRVYADSVAFDTMEKVEDRIAAKHINYGWE